MVAGSRVKTGEINTPFGHEIIGFSVTVGGITDQATVQRSWDDIYKILHSQAIPIQIFEEKDEEGKFKLIVVEA